MTDDPRTFHKREPTCWRMEPDETRTRCLACGRPIHTRTLRHGGIVTEHDGPSVGAKLAALEAQRKAAHEKKARLT